MVSKGTILYALYGATSGECGISQIDGAINQAILAIKPKCGYVPYFISTWLRRSKFSIVSTFLQGGQGNLSGEIVKNLSLMLPCQNEQKKIGELFKKLDSTITLHQRKPKLLSSNLNFFFVSEYAHPWEQRKFDDVFNYLAHNSLSRDDLNDNEGSIKNIHYGDVLIKFGNVIDTKHEYIPYVNDNVKLENKACFLQDGDVVIADAAEDSTVGKCTEISESSDQKIVSGLHTIPCRPKNKFAKGFLGYYLNSNAYHDQLLPLMQGTKVSSISKTSLKPDFRGS